VVIMLGLPEPVVGCLFDLDGVLTNTATVHFRAWKHTFDEVLEARDLPAFTQDDYDDYVDGKRREDGVRDFLASRDVDADDALVTQVGDRKNDLLLETIRKDGVEVYAGSRRYLEAVREHGLRRAVVSSSANTAAVLAATGLDVFIEERVDGTMHLPGKPAPDTFLEGARLLGLEPSQCAVFEDALAGVEAGRAGHFGIVIGVDRVHHADDLRAHGADLVVADLAELL
jgi:beta-phosphoglucomutase family hydrolase